MRRSEKGDTSRVAAVFGVIGAVNIPIINRSVVWWESQHQKASITLGGSSIDDAYLLPLFVSVAGFSLLFGGARPDADARCAGRNADRGADAPDGSED